MTQYLMTVHGPAEMPEFGGYGSREEMEESLASVTSPSGPSHLGCPRASSGPATR